MRNFSNRNIKNRKITDNLIIVVFDIIVLLAVFGVAIEIAHFSNTAVAMIFLAAVVFMYVKKSDLDEREQSDKKFNELCCLYNAHMFTKYKGEYISSVELLDVNKIRITLNNGLTPEIGVRYLSKLERTCDYEKFEQYIVQYINNNSSYSHDTLSIMLENAIQNYLEKTS